MKVPSKSANPVINKTIDIKRDTSQEVLASIGSLSLAYNEVEAAIDRLFFVITGLPNHLQFEVSARYSSADPKIETIKAGAERLLSSEDFTLLSALFSKEEFDKCRDYRNGVIHARHFDPSTNVGIKINRQAKPYDYFFAKKIISGYYDRLIFMQKELNDVILIIRAILALTLLDSADPNRAQLEATLEESRTQFRAHRNGRLSLPRLPESPSELEVLQANQEANTAQTESLMGWFQEWQSQPHFRASHLYMSHQPKFSDAFWEYIAREAEKAKAKAKVQDQPNQPEDKK
jgi:hypothetical protein